MFGVDDILDVAMEAITRKPDDPIVQPLFMVVPRGERITTGTMGLEHNLVGVFQVIDVVGVGRFSISVEECE